jgi:hypothetical protein
MRVITPIRHILIILGILRVIERLPDRKLKCLFNTYGPRTRAISVEYQYSDFHDLHFEKFNVNINTSREWIRKSVSLYDKDGYQDRLNRPYT